MLDTDTLIFMIRGLKSSNGQSASRPVVIGLRGWWIVAAKPRLAATPSPSRPITVAELEFGARQSDRPDDKLRAMHKV